MTKKISNEVLAGKIDALRDHMDLRFNAIDGRVNKIEVESKENSEFRQKATGIIAFVGFVSAVFGGAIIWIFSKLKGG